MHFSQNIFCPQMVFFYSPHGLGPLKPQKLTCVCPKEVNIYTLGPTELPSGGINGPRMAQNGPENPSVWPIAPFAYIGHNFFFEFFFHSQSLLGWS